MARGNVRTHTRKGPDGQPVTVTQHTRRKRGRRGLVRPGRAWRNAKRAWRAVRQHKRGAAAGLAVLALAELAAWTLLQSTAAILVTAGVLALGVAALAALASGVEL
jgi:hypothetical protein